MQIDPKLFALHGHWLTADSVRYALFHEAGGEHEAELLEKLGPEMAALVRIESAMCRLSVFYGLVYVVIEGYRELGERSEAVEELLEDDRVDRLRRFRNAVFHFQKEPFSRKMVEFLEQADSEKWVKQVHRALEQYLRHRLPIDALLAKHGVKAKPTKG